jgi:hypothetical protein
VIRESYWDRDCYRSRDLVELGPDPGEYIVYPGGRSYYIDPELEDIIRSRGGDPDPDQLDDLFWPFVDQDVRHAVEAFRRRQAPFEPPDIRERSQPVHLFDKRRIHFLRFGRMDQGPIGRVPAKIFRPVRNRSRDEIEQHFLQAERILKPHEQKAYVFVIFDLQRFFSQSFARIMPQGLDQEMVDRYFMEEICRLNDNSDFWAGMQETDRLRDYLLRYLFMYYDHDYGQDRFMEDIVRQFMDAHRRHRWPTRAPKVSLASASAIFGVTAETLTQMDRRALSRLFRQKAMQLHPDQGGRQRDFVRLSEAYKSLLQSRR